MRIKLQTQINLDKNGCWYIYVYVLYLYMYLIDISTFQDYWTHFLTIFCKMIRTFGRWFVLALKQCDFNY